MPTCRICQHSFTNLKFQTSDIGICTRCVNTLNNSPEPARNAEERLAEKLARGMQRNAERDLQIGERWRQEKAQKTLADLDAAVEKALHGWITKLLAKPKNSSKDFKIMRAHRRGLLRANGLSEYPKEWVEIAQRIRRRDGYKCTSCSVVDTTLDVHHIIYLSNHGTNQQSNLITLCRKCHEIEHNRLFDTAETTELKASKPISPAIYIQAPELLAISPLQPLITNLNNPSPRPANKYELPTFTVDLSCHHCCTELTIPSKSATHGTIVRCPKCKNTFIFEAEAVSFAVTQLETRSSSVLQPQPIETFTEPNSNLNVEVLHKTMTKNSQSMGVLEMLLFTIAASSIIFVIFTLVVRFMLF